MNVAIVHTNTTGDPSVLITDHGDSYLLARLQELAEAPDPSVIVPVTLGTGGIWEVGGGSILDVREVAAGVRAADVLLEYGVEIKDHFR